MSKPTPASVARTAFFPGMTVIENGKRPPFPGAISLKLLERDPSAATSQTARKPGLGGTPLMEAINDLPSSEKMTWLAEPAGPEGGVVWFKPMERRVLAFAVRPFVASTL